MQIEIEPKEIMMIIDLLVYSDPTGFYCKGLSDKLKELLNVEVKRLQAEQKEAKKEAK